MVDTTHILTPEEKEMADSVDNIGESTLSTVPKEQAVTLSGQYKGVSIEGMEDIPVSMIALPYVRLIQPSSKNTTLDNGKEAPAGTFLFNDTQEYFTSLKFILLRAKHEMKKVDEKGNFVTPDYVGKTQLKPRVAILGITTDSDRLFITSLSPTSFSPLGKLIAKFKALQITKSWMFELTMTAEKTENQKGKYYVANFA